MVHSKPFQKELGGWHILKKQNVEPTFSSPFCTGFAPTSRWRFWWSCEGESRCPPKKQSKEPSMNALVLKVSTNKTDQRRHVNHISNITNPRSYEPAATPKMEVQNKQEMHKQEATKQTHNKQTRTCTYMYICTYVLYLFISHRHFWPFSGTEALITGRACVYYWDAFSWNPLQCTATCSQRILSSKVL